MEIILNRDTERYEVAKAGGWSLASGERARFVMVYIQSNQDIHYFVPSAPGVVNSGGIKVTDSLINCYRHQEQGESFETDLQAVYQQFITIAQDLGYPGVEKLLDPIEEGLRKGKGYDWIVSRGEAVNGRMWADILGWRFIDPTELIRFRKDGRFDERAYRLIASRLRGRDRFVVPGFYGLGSNGDVQTFPRDGSDVTGAIIACGVNASLYRNLTNTNGVLSADPNTIENPLPIEILTFEEYRELGNGGTKVLHRDTIIPVASVGIPINVRHSSKPKTDGTRVVPTRPDIEGKDIIGIVGKGDLVSFNIHRYGLNDIEGIEYRILRIFKENGVSIEHTPTTKDRMSVILEDAQVRGREDRIMEQIQRRIRPTSLMFERNIGFLSMVGQGIRKNRTKILHDLSRALNDRSIQHSGGTEPPQSVNSVLFLDSAQVKEAIEAAYNCFIEKSETNQESRNCG